MAELQSMRNGALIDSIYSSRLTLRYLEALRVIERSRIAGNQRKGHLRTVLHRDYEHTHTAKE